jgi:multidrug efflux pump subunit AcrA (membrane-fusion protein)
MSDSGKRSRAGLIVTAAILALVIATALLAGYLPRRSTTLQLNRDADALRRTPPLVNAATVMRAPSRSEVSFPGSITPMVEAYIYARATGYLKQRYVDIGDHVTDGQLLAEIDAPDLDLQVAQAQASLSQAQGQLGQAEATLQQLIATRDLAAVTWQRYQALTKTGAVSRQAGDTQLTAAKTAEANVDAGQKSLVAAQELVRASQAGLDRLIALQNYEKVAAPFAGVVTARNVDVGALISLTGSTLGPARVNPAGPSDVPSGGEIFRIAQIGTLRVLVPVPQTDASGIQVGQPATVTVEQFPNRAFRGHISRTSESLDAASRTLLTEVEVPNPSGTLLPGMYATVRFITDRSAPPFLVPDASVVVSAGGTSVAVVHPLTPEQRRKALSEGTDAAALERAGIIHFEKVNLGRDYGLTVEVLSGLQQGEYVVVDPGDSVKEGALVQIAPSSDVKDSGGGRK